MTCLRPLSAFLAFGLAAAAAEPWPQFRGPRGDGSSTEAFGPPSRLLWKTALPGVGHSSPAVWSERIFLTSFAPEVSTLRRLAGAQGKLWILCLSPRDGRILWKHEVAAKESEKTTSINTPATPTPATDGSRVYAYFGSTGLTALSANGAPAWHAKIGPFPHHMGAGSSPVLVGGRILLNAESDGPSFLYSIDSATGRIAWQTPRKTRQAAYSTPVVWGETVIVAGHESVMAYALADGQHKWTVAGLSTYVVPTPVVAKDLLFATSGGPGGSGVLALRRNGETAWHTGRGGAYIASPVHSAGRIFTVNSNCVASCLDAKDGRLIWQNRLPAKGECYASPVRAGEVIHTATRAGEVFSFDAAPVFHLRSKYELGEPIVASPAIADGVMYLRSETQLAALRDR